jgi:hypothetical protein
MNASIRIAFAFLLEISGVSLYGIDTWETLTG